MAERRQRKAKNQDSTEFYEAMPFAQSAPYTYSGETYDEPVFEEPTDQQLQDAEAQAKRLAIVTLILVALVALAIGILIARGLQAARETLPAINGQQSNGLEL
jgi:hypothetical protein